MSSEKSGAFTKENLDLYLKELAKEYKKLGGRNHPLEIILIGGAAIIETYSFREMTTDIDAILPAVSIMKSAINHVGDRFHLPVGWLNADFVKTGSYSHHLNQYSAPYKTFSQVLHVRIITGEYLIAMKLQAGRKYKNDFSDIAGILEEQKQLGKQISYEMIDTDFHNLYGGWERFPEDSFSFIHSILEVSDYAKIYEQIRANEVQAKKTLLDFQEVYPGVITEENVDGILASGIRQSGKPSILTALKEAKEQSAANASPPRKEKMRDDPSR